MKRYKSVDEYIMNTDKYRELLIVIRDIICSTQLTETVKWGVPCYTINGKNVVGLAAFKNYVGLWFYQGALLNDKAGVLLNAQEQKTKALRQWRFYPSDDINPELLLEYINEAINNQLQNKTIKPSRDKAVSIPPELQEAFDNDPELKTNFDKFTKGKQREFADHISEAKLEKTKRSRLQKIIPLITENIGLHDKYRK